VTTTTHQQNQTSTPPECVGPLTIPHELTRALHRLAEAAAVDDLVPLWVCATELVRRVSRPGRPIRARVIRGPLETVTPLSTEALDAAVSLREALHQSADHRIPAAPIMERRMSAVSVDVAILVSQDGGRLYVESMTGSVDAPTAQDFACSFLRLLCCAGYEPDVLLNAHPLTGDEA
jgi:hypothetical protein